jgi:MFS family permease
VTGLSIVLASKAVAQLIFLPIGGVIADRCSRRMLMLSTDVGQMLATGVLGLLLVSGHPSIAGIAAAVAVQGVAIAIFQPAAAGLVPSLVTSELLPDVNALSQLSAAATRVAGPALAGTLVVTASPGWALIADSASFVASLASLARLRMDEHSPRSGTAMLAGLREGWAAFQQRTWVWAIAAGGLAGNFGYAIFVVLGPAASLRYYHGAAAWSAINAVGAAGSVLGGLATSRLCPRHPMRWALPAAACFGLPPLALAARLPTAIVAALAVAGETGLLIYVRLYLTMVQQTVPPEVLSRVSSFGMLGSLAVYPLGLAAAGPITHALTIRPALMFTGLGIVVSVLGPLVAPSVRNQELGP